MLDFSDLTDEILTKLNSVNACFEYAFEVCGQESLRLSLKMSTFFSWLISTSNSTTFLPLRMKCQLLWQWFGTKLWIMDFYWITGLDISSSFQLSRQLNRDGLNIFLLGFELNAHVSCINLVSEKVLETTESGFWNDVAVFQGQSESPLLLWARLSGRLPCPYIRARIHHFHWLVGDHDGAGERCSCMEKPGILKQSEVQGVWTTTLE